MPMFCRFRPLLVHEIHGDGTPVPGEVVEEKTRDADLTTAIAESAIIFQVSAQDLSADSVIGFAGFEIAYWKGLK